MKQQAIEQDNNYANNFYKIDQNKMQEDSLFLSNYKDKFFFEKILNYIGAGLKRSQD